MKQVVHYKYLDFPIEVGRAAIVQPLDHPSKYVSNTCPVRTSIVLNISEDGFETTSTFYKEIK